MICNQNVELALGNDCTASVNPYFIIENNWSCQGPMTMEYYDNNGDFIGDLVTGDYLGDTLQVHVTHKWTGLTCWGSVYIIDKKKPVIQPNHLALNCAQDTDVSSVGMPPIGDNCSNQMAISHQDSTFEFDCGFIGFKKYFAPSNWTVTLTDTGDGGVDVTGAPNSILVEGAGNSPQTISPCYVTSFSIVIPADGYVSFDWSSFGGSTFNLDAFYLTINNWSVQLSNDSIQSGAFTTGLLHAGDLLSFDQTSDGDANVVNTLISNFHFQTQAWKVLRRTWSATDEWNNTAHQNQFIALLRTQLSQVVFPPDLDGVNGPILACDDPATPQQTGVPFIDEDGDPNTANDQFPLESGDCFFTLSYEDLISPNCQGSELLVRKWTIADECSGEILEREQLIYRQDLIPPELTCPPPTVLSTGDFGCFSTIYLPQAEAADNCSAIIDITPSWDFGTGYGPFGGIEPGSYTVVYQAGDACGNTSTCSTTVTVEDFVPPTMVCKDLPDVLLNESGQAFVAADAIDDGSFDWCCIESYKIRRVEDPDTAYGSFLTVDCDDLGAPVMVHLQIMDCSGNDNFCEVQISVHDDQNPSILPPADLTVDCSTDIGNLSQFGEPIATDNCNFELVETAAYDLTNCGEGTLTRHFVVSDQAGNTATAQQIIYLSNIIPWNQDGSLIEWPPDLSLPGCGVSMEPHNLPPPYNAPGFPGEQSACQSLTVNHQDEIVWIAEPACYFIYRNWIVTDWCQYQQGGNAGIWQHIQVLEVQDNEPPAFINAPSDIHIPLENGCFANVNLPSPEADDCSNQTTITASGALGNGFNFQNVQAGVYPMTYIASDGCGNVATHNFTVTVADDEPPHASCLNGLTVMLDYSGQLTINASVFNLNSFDDCTAPEDLQFSFSPVPGNAEQTFNCDDVGQNSIQLWVFDQGGNAAFCQTYLMIPDYPAACDPNFQPGQIAGMIQTPTGQPVGEADIHLAGDTLLICSTQPETGEYFFENLSTSGSYAVTPQKNANPLNGVSSFDLTLISNHILGNSLFTEPWQFIAADANNSGSVTTADLTTIQSLILGNTVEFPHGVPSWRFIPTDSIFSEAIPSAPYPQSILFDSLADNSLAADFTAVKTGDVSGNANPAFLSGSNEQLVAGNELRERSGGVFIFKVKDKSVLGGGEVEAVFESETAAAAWQFTLNFDPNVLSFIGLEDNFLQKKSPVTGLSHIENGQLGILWYGQPERAHFTLKFKALTKTKLSEALQLNSTLTPAFAWTEQGDRLMPGMYFVPANAQAGLFGNRPNPFSQQTILYYELPEAGAVKFSFFDISGRLLRVVETFAGVGSNELLIRCEDLAGDGIIFYKMETPTEALVGKMLLQQ